MSNIERVRTACFAWFAQMNRTAAVRHVPIEYRGRPAVVAEMTGTGESWREVPCRTLAERVADNVAAVGILRDAWQATEGTTKAPAHRLAVDWASAVADAGLVDIDATRFPGLYTVTPRDATPHWEIRRDETPSPVPSVEPFHGTSVRPYGRLEAYEYERGASAYEQVCNVPTAIVEASATDPGRYHPASMALAHAATVFFAEQGEKHPSADVWDVRRKRFHARPDRVAFKGVARIKRPAPMRYERKVTDATAIGADGQIELTTRFAWWVRCTCSAKRRDACICTPSGFIGHRSVRFARTVRGSRALLASARPAHAGKRGPVVGQTVTPFAMSDRSLPRATAHLSDHVALIESIIRSVTDDQTVTFYDGTTVTRIGSAQVFDNVRERAYPIREWARRAALAGIVPND